MAVVPIFLHMLAGIGLIASMYHILVAWRGVDRKIHLTFGLAILLLPVYTLTAAYLYYVRDAETFLATVRIQMFCTPIFFITYSWFIAFYTKVKARLWLFTITLVYTLIPLFRLTSPTTLVYTNIKGMKPVVLPWGERIYHLEADLSILGYLYFSLILVIFTYIFWAAASMIKRGEKRKGYFLIFSQIFLIVTVFIDILIDTMHLTWIYMGEFGLIAMIVLMSFKLSDELYRATLTRHIISASEKKYQEIFNATNEAIFLHNSDDGRIIEVNQAMLDMYGYSSADLDNLTVGDLSSGEEPYSQQKAEEKIRQAALSDPQIFEWHAKRKNGSCFWVEVSLRKSDISGQRQIIAIVRDITYRKTTMQVLLESEQNYQEIFNATSESIMIHDPLTGDIIDANAAFERLFGYTWNEARNLILADISSGYQFSTKEEAAKLMQRAIKGETPLVEWLARHKNGHHFWVEITLRSALISGQQRILSVARDISQRKQDQELMNRLLSIIEATSDFIGMATLDNKISYLNRAGRELIGWSDEEDIHDHSVTELHPTWAADIIITQGIPSAIKNGVWVGETALKTSEGKEIPTSQAIMFHQGSAEQPDYLSTIIRDIAERKRSEELLRIQRDASISFGKATDLVDSIKRLLDSAFRIDEFDAGGIYILDKNTGALDLLVHHGLSTEFIQTATHYEADTPQTQLILKGKPVYLNYPDLKIDVPKSHRKEGLKAIGMIPITHENKVIGAMNLASFKYESFSVSIRDTIEIFSGMISSVIARLDVEEALRESEEKFRNIITSSPMGIHMYELDSSNKLIFKGANPAADKILGVDNSLFVGKILEEVFPPLAGTEVPDRYRQAAANGKPWFNEQIDYQDKQIKGAFEVYAFQTSPRKMSVMFLEITKRKQAEAALRQSEEKYRDLFEYSPDAIAITSLDSSIIDCNEEALRIMGFESRDQVIGTAGLELLAPRDRERAQHELQRTLQLGHSRNIEYMLQKKDTTTFPAEVSASLIRDNTGNPTSFMVIIKDITERKRIEEIMVQSEKMLSVGGLAAGLAHEINNPLSAILQKAQVIQERLSMGLPKNEQVAKQCGISFAEIESYLKQRGILEMIQSIRDAGSRTAKIIENMLSFSRKSDTHFQQQSITSLLDETIELASSDYDLKKKYDFRDITITREYEAQIPEILCEKSEIQQVFLNLLRNGAQAMMNMKEQALSTELVSPRFIIRCKNMESWIHIEIEDNGIGMNEYTRKRAFEPFFTTKEVGIGTGLGLSVSYFIIVDKHKGSIDIESQQGKGAKFTIRLPVNRNGR